MEKRELKTLKITALAALYTIYLMLSFIASGELAYRFAKEIMGIAAYIILTVHFAIGTTIFIYSLKKVLKEK
jgi:hypothetical protein